MNAHHKYHHDDAGLIFPGIETGNIVSFRLILIRINGSLNKQVVDKQHFQNRVFLDQCL